MNTVEFLEELKVINSAIEDNNLDLLNNHLYYLKMVTNFETSSSKKMTIPYNFFTIEIMKCLNTSIKNKVSGELGLSPYKYNWYKTVLSILLDDIGAINYGDYDLDTFKIIYKKIKEVNDSNTMASIFYALNVIITEWIDNSTKIIESCNEHVRQCAAYLYTYDTFKTTIDEVHKYKYYDAFIDTLIKEFFNEDLVSAKFWQPIRNDSIIHEINSADIPDILKSSETKREAIQNIHDFIDSEYHKVISGSIDIEIRDEIDVKLRKLFNYTY